MPNERKKVLILSDSARLQTGFSNVTREIWTYLNKTGKYDIRQIGWFHQESDTEVTWPIIPTTKDERGIITQDDKYAHKSFPGVVDEFKPDLVWSCGDQWMTDHIGTSRNRSTYKWIMYTPLDGHPCPSKWGKTYDAADIVVAYGKYGMEIIKHRAPKANVTYIPHGVDSTAFSPMPEQGKLDARRNIIGVPDGKILIGIIARNQPRKSFDKLFEAYYYVLSGNYNVCTDCGETSLFPYDLLRRKAIAIDNCLYCGGKNVTRGKERDDVRLYIHGAIMDCGWDLMDLQNDYNLGGKVLVNPALRVGMGVPENTLNGIYNALDIFTLPTRGEGFGLPVLEAMSCGIPIVVTDYSAHPEWCQGCGELVPPIALEAEPVTNIRRAIIDTNRYVGSLLKLIDNRDLRREYGDNGRKVAISMDWNGICNQWEELIDRILFPSGDAPKKIELSDLKYSLEEM